MEIAPERNGAKEGNVDKLYISKNKNKILVGTFTYYMLQHIVNESAIALQCVNLFLTKMLFDSSKNAHIKKISTHCIKNKYVGTYVYQCVVG